MATTEPRKGRRPRHDTPLTTEIRGAGQTDIGHVRARNEDAILVAPDLGLYAVFDGMGGHNAGDVASRLASECVADHVRKEAALRQRAPREVLERAFLTASAAVLVAGETFPQCRGLGTTAVACLVVDPTRVVVAHTGDSRAYLLRGGELAALTRDHTVVQELIDQGKLGAGSTQSNPMRNMITRSLGDGSGRPDLHEQVLEPGDRLLLCSDGLHGYTPDRAIQRVLAADGAAEQLAGELIALALQRPAPDNVSVVVITVDGGRVRAARPRRSARARTRRGAGPTRR